MTALSPLANKPAEKHAAAFDKGETKHVDHAFLDDGVIIDTSGEDSDFIYIPGSKEEKALVRKIDMRMMPMLWVMYVFNYIDRTNIGNAKTGGMESALGLTSSDYSLALSIFFVGYLLNEIPMNMILSRSRPSLFLPSIMLVWGCISVAARGINSLGGLVAWRLVLGLVEAGFFPGVLLLFSMWYRPFEIAKRLSLFYSASLVSGAFGGILGGVITSYMNGLGKTAGWKWLFMIEGLATVVISCVAYFILPDFPKNTSWLTPNEKKMAILRLHEESDNLERLTHKQSFFAACRDWKTWACSLIYSLINGAGTISYFFPTLMTNLGYSGRTAQFMTVPIYMVSLIISLAMGFSADYFREKPFHVVGTALFSGAVFLCCAFIHNNTARYVLICFGGGGLWSAIPLYLGFFSTAFKGKEKRAVSIAIVNGIGNLSSVYGSFIWPSNTAPQFKLGFACTTGFIWAAAVLTLVMRLLIGDTTRQEEAAIDNAHRQVAAERQAKLGVEA